MKKEVAVYLEGGGDTAATITPFRHGWSAFLKPVIDTARKSGVCWRVISCGGRQATYDAFCDALVNEPTVCNFMLVDSEEPVSTTVWEHLKNRVGDQWAKPLTAKEDRCHLMVVTMETWFLADPEAVQQLYKHTKGFKGTALNGIKLRALWDERQLSPGAVWR